VRSQNTSVRVVTKVMEWAIEELRFDSGQGQEIFHLSIRSTPTLGVKDYRR
jgi:hypothetical protein